VVSRQRDYRPEGVLVVPSLEAALERAQAIAAADDASEIMIGGGGAIYAEAMPLADRLYISHVALNPAGDTHFPAIRPEEWQETGKIDVPTKAGDTAAFRVSIYERRRPARR
jgi:dihydrofolate reductase